jgi:hypothetical protein
MAKPPLPVNMFDTFPRITVDMSTRSDADEIAGIADLAAAHWALGPDGPYKRPEQPLAEIVRNAIREGLTHLLELGFIDIDSERMHAAKGWPMHRQQLLPAGELPGSTSPAATGSTTQKG